ncbi:M14 family zinc carboxypeptidase [Azohydromonas caseinilytica]|uniref:Zinc carboxypeptidase n=1 Tax=Azohydromonas caseinilytica TaxID=2728836 RepID=A0A848FGN8_9BURK|nr:M14 family zinc carboxypeptidase [Azohydromonas caseinilytica]NML18306.1 zinc carboxypeptidase [Azohydromonas caseinilytica]
MRPAAEPAELVELQRLLDGATPQLQVRSLCEVESGGRRWPVLALTLGNAAPQAPAAGFFGGVHGLERIGTAVVLSFLGSVLRRLRWDALLQQQLERMRLVFMPVVNPGGLWAGTRANPQGVDLMRNAPLEASEPAAPLVGGQRLTRRLPWYRGPRHAPLQPESQALCAVVEAELLSHAFSIAVDCHSGFGLRDRLWFPYAGTRAPVPHLPELHALSRLLDEALPQHRYVFEPQSRHYLAHGDLWDFLYRRACRDPGRTFLPLTLEMGSWLWVRKNPRQLLSAQGLFNPLPEHRHARVLRRHQPWLELVARAACSHRAWCPAGAERERQRDLALRRWYAA